MYRWQWCPSCKTKACFKNSRQWEWCFEYWRSCWEASKEEESCPEVQGPHKEGNHTFSWFSLVITFNQIFLRPLACIFWDVIWDPVHFNSEPLTRFETIGLQLLNCDLRSLNAQCEFQVNGLIWGSTHALLTSHSLKYHYKNINCRKGNHIVLVISVIVKFCNALKLNQGVSGSSSSNIMQRLTLFWSLLVLCNKIPWSKYNKVSTIRTPFLKLTE